MKKSRKRWSGESPASGGNAGLTLVETMAAAIVLAIGILGLLSAVSSSVILDQVGQENNLALDTARQIIEQVKSEGFENLLERVDATADPEQGTTGGVVIDDPDNPEGDGTDGEDGEDGEEGDQGDYGGYYEDGYGWGAWYPGSYDYYPYSNNIQIDAAGNFNLVSYKNGQSHNLLSPWPGAAHVGKVNVRQLENDVVEVTVTMRWSGKKGQVERVLRCQLGDW